MCVRWSACPEYSKGTPSPARAVDMFCVGVIFTRPPNKKMVSGSSDRFIHINKNIHLNMCGFRVIVYVCVCVWCMRESECSAPSVPIRHTTQTHSRTYIYREGERIRVTRGAPCRWSIRLIGPPNGPDQPAPPEVWRNDAKFQLRNAMRLFGLC